MYLPALSTVALEEILSLAAGMSYDGFARDSRTSRAVDRNLEILGEAVKSQPTDLKDRHASLPWGILAGMRDTLIHPYFGVDLRVAILPT